MKRLFGVVLVLSVMLACISCGSGDRSKELSSYKYDDGASVQMNDILQKKVGSWIKSGMTCYGIIILYDENSIPLKMSEVEAKVVAVEKDRIKMKSLENIQLSPKASCNKSFGIKEGEAWDETEGDLFKTREEAVAFIDKNYPGLRVAGKK